MSAEIRVADAADLAMLAGIEDAADALLVEYLSAAEWGAAPSGAERASMPGFILVADSSGQVVGFVHVLQAEGAGHLEQLSVLPEFGRQGIGRALVEAAKDAAAARSHESLTLRTYADVPWNAPFYETCGFVETTPETSFQRQLVATEDALGLARYGRRVQMTARLRLP